MTAEKVREMLRNVCRKAGGQSQWAGLNGMSGVYVSDVLAGRKEPAGKMLAALGLERVVTYRKVRTNG
jgi:hypothetical protein